MGELESQRMCAKAGRQHPTFVWCRHWVPDIVMAQKPMVLQCKSPYPQHVRMVVASRVVHARAQNYGEATEVGLCSCVTKAGMLLCLQL